MNQSLRQRLPQQHRFKAPLPYIDLGSDSRSQLRWEGRIPSTEEMCISCLGAGGRWQTHCQPLGRKKRVFSLIIALHVSATSFKGICILQG